MKMIWFVSLVMVMFLGQLVKSDGTDNSSSVKALRQLLRTYSNIDRPSHGTDKADQVNVSMYIMHVRAVSELDMAVTYDLYLRYMWNDPRLVYSEGPNELILSADEYKKFWTPDLFIVNAHNVGIHKTLDTNSASRIRKNGDVLVTSKVSITAQCEMNLAYFPHDVQKCGFRIESYMYSTEYLKLNITSCRMAQSMSTIAFHTTLDGTSVIDENIGTKSYQSVAVTVNMARTSGHYLVLVYVPSFVLVALSCLVFWLPPAALMERTLYSVFLLFSMVPIMVGSQFGAPMVGYLKAIDLWVVTCFFFLSIAVFEVLVFHLVFGRGLLAKASGDQFQLVNEDESNRNEAGVKFGPWSIRPDIAKKIDLALRGLFPTAFLVFNIVYWATYR